MRFALDSNILVYAFIREDPAKHELASEIMVRAMTLDAVIAAQSLGEFLNVIKRKQPTLFSEACEQARRWKTTFGPIDTTVDHILKGAHFAGRYQLQIWDSIIWQIVRSAHAVILLTEDLQDGLTIDGMKALNPFNPSNKTELERLLASSDYEID